MVVVVVAIVNACVGHGLDYGDDDAFWLRRVSMWEFQAQQEDVIKFR